MPFLRRPSDLFRSAIAAAFLVGLAAYASSVRAADVQGIAAIVNDSVISSYDLEQRVELVIASAGVPRTPENLERVRQQVLRSLIDERLQLQESERLEIEVTQAEVDEALQRIAERSNQTPETIRQYLRSNNIDMGTLTDQIVSEIAWNKVVSQRFAPLVNVSDEEVNEVLTRLEADADQERYLISEIYLGFDDPTQEREIANGAQKLVEQLRGGAPFPAVATQFSQSPSAASGGDIGWVQAAQLPEEIAGVLPQLQIGQVSDPIRTISGYYIVQVRNRRSGTGPDPLQTQLQLLQVLLPLAANAPPPAVQARAQETQRFVQSFKTCAGVPDQVNRIQGAKVAPMVTVTAGQLSDALRAEVLKREAGEMVPPVRTPRGIEIFIICDRKDDLGEKPTRDAIEDNLFSQQLAMVARRHLRDLRRDAVIEVR